MSDEKKTVTQQVDHTSITPARFSRSVHASACAICALRELTFSNSVRVLLVYGFCALFWVFYGICVLLKFVYGICVLFSFP